jgi:Ca2+-transporting ATPase
LTPDHNTAADFEVEDNSFVFSPRQLNKLINPKSLAAFYVLGGLAGLEKGLRTDRRAGLSVDEVNLDGTVTFEEALAVARDSVSPPQPRSDMTTPLDQTDSKCTTQSRRVLVVQDAFCDRKRIFSDNRLPVKKGKSLLQLIWITYNDKVLILLSVAAAISLAVGLY